MSSVMIYMTIACITWINLFFYPQCNPSSLLLISVSVFYNLYLFLFPTMCSVWCIWCFADLLQVMERTTIRRRKRRSCPSVRGTRATWSCGRWPRPSSQGTKETDQAVSYLGGHCVDCRNRDLHHSFTQCRAGQGHRKPVRCQCITNAVCLCIHYHLMYVASG